MSKIVVANMKNALTKNEVIKYNNISKLDKIDLIICPSYIHLGLLDNDKFKLGVQNIYNEGICTGEISINQLKEYNVQYSIIGHMERRVLFNETNSEINSKINACLENGIKVVLCIGNKNDSLESIYNSLENELSKALNNISSLDNIIISYEPYSNVGLDNEVNIQEVKLIKEFICNLLSKKYNKIPTIIYGGNVNSSNVKEIIDIYDGIMVGRSTFKYDNFALLMDKLTN